MIGKLIVYALEYDGAVKKAFRALDEFFIDGIITNIPLHKAIVTDKDFQTGSFDTSYLEKTLPTFNLGEHKTKHVKNKSFVLKGVDELLY